MPNIVIRARSKRRSVSDPPPAKLNGSLSRNDYELDDPTVAAILGLTTLHRAPLHLNREDLSSSDKSIVMDLDSSSFGDEDQCVSKKSSQDEHRKSSTVMDVDHNSSVDQEKSASKNISQDDHGMTFPQKLMHILSNEKYSEIISWLPHGRGFMIYRKQEFADEVLPHYFKQAKYQSFTRKMNRWLFTRVARGPEIGAYYHKYFQRQNPKLCLKMTCISVPQQKTANRSSDNEGAQSPTPQIIEGDSRDKPMTEKLSLSPKTTSSFQEDTRSKGERQVSDNFVQMEENTNEGEERNRFEQRPMFTNEFGKSMNSNSTSPTSPPFLPNKFNNPSTIWNISQTRKYRNLPLLQNNTTQAFGAIRPPMNTNYTDFTSATVNAAFRALQRSNQNRGCRPGSHLRMLSLTMKSTKWP